MERETTTIEVAGHTLKVKTYASAREANIVQQVYKNAVKVKLENGKPEITDLDPFEVYPVQVEMIRQLVVEMDGSTEKITDRCEDLPSDVFQDIANALDGVIAKKKTP